MKKLNPFILLLAIIVIVSACQKSEIIETVDTQSENLYSYENGEIIPNHFIVKFKKDVLTDSKFKISQTHNEKLAIVEHIAKDIEQEVTGEVREITNTYYKVLQGFAGELSNEMVLKLQNDPRIESIEPDRIVALKKPNNPGGKPGGGGGGSIAQTTPWGISRVNGGSSGVGKVAWIIDSGIDLDHPDLNVNTSLSRSFLGGKQSGNPDDQNGHGTHVAGTVAAIDNEIGVIGVAAGATVISVRVLDRRGSGSLSGVIQGVEYVAATASSGDVANMSLGGGISTTLDAAVIEASKTCPFTLAAGNDGDDAEYHSPARAETSVGVIYTISAMNSNDNWASWSNYGSHVDYCQPGVSIESCWKDGGYNTINGTSMAAPHMAGLVLIGFGQDGTVNNDPDGNADPIAVH